MRTGTEFLPTLAVTTLGAVATVMAAGTSADAAPGDTPSRSCSACQGVGGSYEGKDFGGWFCTHPVGAESYEPVLTAVCGTTPSTHVIDGHSPSGTIGFYCPPPLVS
jgi:hypothetical protein